MDVNRRAFLKLAGGAGVASAAGAAAVVTRPRRASAAVRHGDDAVGMLVDTTRCVGCRACEAACSETHRLPAPAMLGQDTVFAKVRRTESTSYTVVNRFAAAAEGGAAGAPAAVRFVKTQCMHCVDPACASACLVKALEKTPEGPVVYHRDRCIGCRYCMVACPFGVPAFEYEKVLPYVTKCTFCVERQQQSQAPACATVCPSGALTFGTRKALLETAKTRIYRDAERYVHHVYGEREAGGTSWLYITDVPFEQVGFRTDVPMRPFPELTWTFLSAVPFVLMLWPPFLMGLYTFSRERREARPATEAERTRETTHA
ncbi:MAG: 4Fe-4S dicluster domain-containing protein [Candidatus Rokubacteria bacterium]|nr:4Fe-4S dicluster domain-containing protein [Candidatus Rokubacteria bacterium]